MRIRIDYTTVYDYAADARDVVQLLRVQPRSGADQIVGRWRIDVDADGALRPGTDPFGNCTHMFTADGPLRRLTLRVTGEVDTQEAHGAVRGFPEPLPATAFLRTTALTEPDPAILAFAAALPDAPVLDRLHDLNAALFAAMTFDAAATGTGTDAATAFAQKSGVCQDYSHIFCVAARSLGVPARYVSGHYVRAEAQPAGHAWAEALVPDLGWVGFDPTNGISTTPAHVRVAVGLDYLDAAPVRGARRGGGTETLAVRVHAVDTAQSQSQSQAKSEPGPEPVADAGVIEYGQFAPTEEPMTYCVGVLVRDGLAMLADTRTNAGLDNISSYRKLRIMDAGPGRTLVVASAGSLSVTQAALTRLTDAMLLAEGEGDAAPETLKTAPTMFRAATLVGQALHAARTAIDETTGGDRVSTGATLLFGGCIAGRRPRLFLIYGSGNFIECQADTPYLQVGEHKYGKPILDRVVTYDTPLDEAVKVALISFSSTMRSNLAVGLPIDLMTLRSGDVEPGLVHRITDDDDYYRELTERWSAAMRTATMAIAPPPYGQPAAQGVLV